MLELKTYLRVVLKGWWLVISALLISVTSTLVFTYSQTPIYRTDATFVVSPSAALENLNDVVRGLDTLTKRDGITSTYAEIAISDAIVKAAYRELNLSEEQKENLTVTSELVHSTNIIQIIVESDDPIIARDCADLVGQKTIEFVGNLYEAYDMKPLDPAYIPPSPSKPDMIQNLLLATILGAVGGIGSAFLLEYLHSSEGRTVSVSIIDSDTGVYNQYYFLQRLGEELNRSKRHRHPLSLALMSIERLDVINDMRLPRLRNQVLRQVGLFLKRYLREEDLIARFEGDKFALLLPDTSGSDAKLFLDKLQSRIEWNIFELEEGGIKLNLTSTSGIVAYDFNGVSRDELVVKAEKALRCASDNGYGKIYLLDDQPDTVLDSSDSDK